MINTTKILSYPNDVTYNDGHYLLFKIFERPGVEYTSPYTDVNIPTQIQNKNALAARGEYSKEREAIRAKLNRSNNKGLKEIVSKLEDGKLRKSKKTITLDWYKEITTSKEKVKELELNGKMLNF